MNALPSTKYRLADASWRSLRTVLSTLTLPHLADYASSENFKHPKRTRYLPHPHRRFLVFRVDARPAVSNDNDTETFPWRDER